jgi:excisionase family DNA binding protein
MTKLLTIPEFAEATGLSYRLCLQLIESGKIPSVPVGTRRRIDVRWVEQWLSTGGYRPEDALSKSAETSQSCNPSAAAIRRNGPESNL